MSVNKKRSKANESSKTTNHDGDAPTAGEKKAQKKLIVKFVTSTLEKGPTGLRAEFQGMKRANNFKVMTAFTAAQPYGKNRYKDVGCLDNQRVVLKDWHHDYIHANFVQTPDNKKRFICTQAPLESTCADFWWMCLQEKVETIFMLRNFMEKNIKKCHEYFPTKEKDTLVFEEYALKLNDDKKPVKDENSKAYKITVRYESSKKFKFKGKDITAKVTQTELSIEGPNDTTLKTMHYQWHDWPDRGVPPADMAIVELLEKTRSNKNPIAVHCSAGIGRTGSVVMIDYAIEQFLAGSPIEETDKMLQKIRETRNNTVQTDQQYLFVHQVLMCHFKNKKLLDKSVEGAHKDFTEAYDKLIIN